MLTLATASVVAAAPGMVPRGVDPPTKDDPNFISRIMDAHWYWRKIHCAQDLTWDPALAQAAFESVSACTAHPQHDRGGSNLSSVSGVPGTYDDWLEFARTVVHGWHEEESKYPYDNPSYADAWGHFTQVVWRDTSRIGCALGSCPGRDWPGRLYCFYETPGNNIAVGQFGQNVWGPQCPDPSKAEVAAAALRYVQA
ncbi:PR-1-like protein [Pleomassaria siparia CBS 279.74]|uniref:PR-1-like protein n=1 Tax=Pleomassaria siparia CBS 279.74 TaxID=1314801 RepID=A0A6G1KBS2_9PLEO|nr:PR-1-like protein [Pleomassaria siparia CBS 279.74]